MHGAGGGGASTWTTGTNLASLASKFTGIAVLVEGGRAGWYTNWVSRDLKNHLSRVRKVCQLKLSMGGHGALSYAGQRPDLYSKVASFSGPGDIEDPSISQLVIANEVTKFAGTVAEFGSAIYPSEKGDFAARAADVTLVLGPMTPWYNAWAPKNAYRLGGVYNSNGIDVSLYCGYGGTSDAAAGSIEYAASVANDKMYGKFKSNGLQVRYCAGVGDHSMKYWQADLADWLDHTYNGQVLGAPCPSGWAQPRP